MRKVFDVLESNGLLSEVDATQIYGLSREVVVKLYEGVYTTIFDSQQRQIIAGAVEPLQIDPFTFFAGASVRGDSGCGAPLCRIQKIDFLGRYAALYANEVVVPLPLTHPEKVHAVAEAKKSLARSATTLLRLRPLITQGIIRPVVMRTTHCEHEIKWVDQMRAVVHELADEAAKLSLAEFDLEYQLPEKAPTGLSTVYINGPGDFLEHGNIVNVFRESPGWKLRSWRYDSEGKTILRGKKKLWFVRLLFNEIANNTSFYLAYGRLQKARFLTDLPGEAFVLDWLTGDERLAASTSAMKLLTHAVPILADVPIATVMRIRREERDSFESYRMAVTKIAREVLQRKSRLSRKEAREMLRALVEPEIMSIRKEIRSERERQARRISGGLASLAAGVAIGAFGGLPIAVTGAIAGAAALVGGRLLAKAADEACEHGTNLRQQNDLYFLVRLMQEEPS
jgi:hypothetical protein